MAANLSSRPEPLTPTPLKRSIGLVLLTLYGLGTILGAGIYVLIGEVAGATGSAIPGAFLLAGLIAAFSALTYAELGGRLPKSAGEAAYVEAAFRRRFPAVVTGWAVIATGVVSSATLVRGFIGYLEVFLDVPDALVIVIVVTCLGVLAAWGIAESLWAAGLVTVVEVLGLLTVCFIARDSLAAPAERWIELLPAANPAAWTGLFTGGFIAFYAYIGFEDMVNVAEEVIEPERTLPRAILAALLISTGLYLLVATVAALALPAAVLASSDAPMAAIVESRGYSPVLVSLVGLFAVINGALIQIVMASRVLYGLGAQGLAWRLLARVHAGRRTPIVATAAIVLSVLVFALLLPIGHLARVTSFIALVVFLAVNLSLIALKQRDTARPQFSVPRFVPVVGAALCTGMLLLQLAALIEGQVG